MSKEKRYYETDPDKIQKALAEIGQGDYFKPKEGKNVIRILPPWSKKGLWYKEATIHYGLAVEGKERGYTCLKQFDKDCPICEKRDELLKGDSEDKELADKLRPRLKYYANILDRTTGRVMIWGFTPKTLGILLGYEADPDHCNNKLTDPEEGYDVVIERTGTGRNDTKYNIRVKPKSSEIGDDSDWEDKMKDLDDIVEEPDEEKVQDALSEMFGGKSSHKKHKEDEDEDEDEPHKKKHEEKEEIEEGDRVSFTEDGEDYEGKVDEINEKKGTAVVIDEDGDEHKVDLEDLEKEEKKKHKEDEDEDEPRKKKKQEDEDEDEPKKKKDEDDDDEAEARKKRKERREARKKKNRR